MIARLWRGEATRTNAEAYRRHFEHEVRPSLAGIAGHRGAWLLQRDVDGHVEFLAVTLWDSLDAIRAFAGDAVASAVVEPGARAALSAFDAAATHFEVVDGDCSR